MELDHRSHAASAALTSAGVGAATGKRTLTDGLGPASAGVGSATAHASGAIQRRAIQRQAATTPASDPRHDAQQQAQPADSDAARGAAITGLLSSFQHVHVDVPAPNPSAAPAHGWAKSAPIIGQAEVSIPYWNNKYVKSVGGEKLPPPAGFDLNARNVALYTLPDAG